MSKDKIKKKSITQKDNKKDGENKNNNNQRANINSQLEA